MKKKPKASKPTTGRRGDPQANAYSKWLALHYGKAAACPSAFQLVATRNFLDELIRRLELDKQRIGEARIEAGKTLKEPGGDLRVERYWWTRRYLDSAMERALTTAKVKLAIALYAGDADFFRKLADAIEGTAEHANAPVYPLQSAICLFATRDEKMTIGELCKQPEIHELRPTSLSDESWQRRVRTVCEEVGYDWAKSNPRTESNRQRFTPSKLGLPKNYGTSSFWRRNDLMDQLEKAQKGYRALMLRVHPDKGGDAETFHKVKRLWRNVKNRFKKQGVQLT